MLPALNEFKTNASSLNSMSLKKFPSKADIFRDTLFGENLKSKAARSCSKFATLDAFINSASSTFEGTSGTSSGFHSTSGLKESAKH